MPEAMYRSRGESGYGSRPILERYPKDNENYCPHGRVMEIEP